MTILLAIAGTDQAFIGIDTLVFDRLDPAVRPCHASKLYLMHELNGLIAFRGLHCVWAKWCAEAYMHDFNSLSELTQSAPARLTEIFDQVNDALDHKAASEGVFIPEFKRSTTIYHFGFDHAAGVCVATRHRAENAFEPEDVYGHVCPPEVGPMLKEGWQHLTTQGEFPLQAIQDLFYRATCESMRYNERLDDGIRIGGALTFCHVTEHQISILPPRQLPDKGECTEHAGVSG